MIGKESPNPVGCPSSYVPEYCEQIIELGKDGKSIVQFANHFQVVKNTLDNWAKEFPEFLIAFTRAKQLSQEWWENTAQTHMIETSGGTRINHGVWSRSMAARFPDDYREKSTVALEGGDPNKPVKQDFTLNFNTPSHASELPET